MNHIGLHMDGIGALELVEQAEERTINGYFSPQSTLKRRRWSIFETKALGIQAQ